MLIDRYIEFCDRLNINTTVFILGATAKNHPEAIQSLINSGHEIGCHTVNHNSLQEFTRESFKEDLLKNCEVLNQLGAVEIRGFRSPFFSCAPQNQWIWEVLKDLGFVYSSSVLPARSPMYGWKNFGLFPCEVHPGFFEIPVSVSSTPFYQVPFASGACLRFLPDWSIKHFQKRYDQTDCPLVNYIHPHDFDHDTCAKSKDYGRLFKISHHYNRKSVFLKLTRLINEFRVRRYVDYCNERMHASDECGL